MGGSKGVTHIEVCQRSEFFHHLGLGLLNVAQAQLLFKEGLLLRHKTDVVQQQDFPFPQAADGFPGSGTAHIVDPLHFPAQQLSQYSGMGLGAIVVFIFDVASLMGQQHQLCSLVRKLPHRGHAGPDAVDAFQGAGGPVHGLVDVHPAENGFPPHGNLVQGTDPKSHGALLTS